MKKKCEIELYRQNTIDEKEMQMKRVCKSEFLCLCDG